MSWNTHVDTLCKKISQRLGIFRRIRHYLTFKARLAFCQCLILSLIDYCCVVWGNTSQQNLERIHRLQTTRLLLNKDYKAPSLPLFLQLGWLPIHERIKFLRAVTVFKALNNLTSNYITNLIKPFNTVYKRNTRGAGQNILKVPLQLVTAKAGMRTFAFIGAKEWNGLGKDIRNATSLLSFKNIYLKAKFDDLKKFDELKNNVQCF